MTCNHRRRFRFLILLLAFLFSSGAVRAEEEKKLPGVLELDEIVVTSQRREQPALQHAGNIARVSRDDLEQLQAEHIHEVMNEVAGAWIVRGSGQEHQTAIRSPVLGGGGSCGGFLLLEDGIPIRPAGFCNINQFIEYFSEEADSIEVIRGPGNALFGSNALHGIVNVLMPKPSGGTPPHISLETGANDFYRLEALAPFEPGAPWVAAGMYSHDGGFRDDSGYTQAKVHAKRAFEVSSGDLLVGFTATDLDQDTAGFITGRDAYEDPELSRTNPDPDAFRNVSSQRLYGIFSRPFDNYDLEIRPHARHSRMHFLHFARPGQPEEKNGQTSAGAMITWTFDRDERLTTLGIDIDWSQSYLEQTQYGPTGGGPRQEGTIPQGKQYDYEVDALDIAAYVQTQVDLGERLTLGAGLRIEHSRYDYDNRMLDGNTRDDGTPCGFGGCLYSRPSDRSDDFTDLAPNASLIYALNPATSLFTNLTRGFRVPQTIELYRLQNGQLVSDLGTETVDSLEVGIRMYRPTWSAEISAYAMRKKNSTFVDSEGFNVSGAKSRHHGIEVSLDWLPHQDWTVSANGAYGRHEYDFDAQGRGSTFVSGMDIESAPRWLGSAELLYQPGTRLAAGLRLVTLGDYYLDSLNRFTYPGHTLLNFRLGYRISDNWNAVARLNNISDTAYADRADFAMGDYRYLPGRDRELFLELRYSPASRLGE